MKRTLLLMVLLLLSLQLFALPREAEVRVTVLSEKKAVTEGIPFKENASRTAKKSDTMRFYFMSGEGKVMLPSEGTKWGDATLVVFPSGETMLIDSGMWEYGPRLVKNLKALGVKKLDYVVVSHSHPDHFGGMMTEQGVLANFEIGTFCWSGLNCELYHPDWADFFNESYEKYIRKKGVKEMILRQGVEFNVGDVKIKIFNPTDSDVGNFKLCSIAGMLDENNNDSIVMKFSWKKFSSLFAGDLYKAREERLVKEYGDELKVDLLKANHHGNDTSNGKVWAETVSPKTVVAMQGYQMAGAAYENYANTGSRVLVETFDGYVRTVTDGGTYMESTASRKRGTTLYAYYDLKAGNAGKK